MPYEEYDEEYDPWAFIYNLKFTPRSHISNGSSGPVLPEQEVKRNTLVLDLDETLVHSNLENTGEKCDFSFPVVFNNEVHQVNVKKRPHLSTFMEVVSKQYEIVVFTASQQVYADKLLDILDPKRTWIKHRVFRDSCVQIDGNFMKICGSSDAIFPGRLSSTTRRRLSVYKSRTPFPSSRGTMTRRITIYYPYSLFSANWRRTRTFDRRSIERLTFPSACVAEACGATPSGAPREYR